MLRRFFFASVAGLIATAALPNVPDAAAAVERDTPAWQ